MNYEPIVLLDIDGPPKYCTGDCDKRQCRYCGKREPEVKFRNIAHALPECIGNTAIIAYDECDTCNDYFSRTLEDSLGKFLLPARVIMGVEGKEGVPSYKFKDKKSRIDPDEEKPGVRFSILGDDPIIYENEEQQILNMDIPSQTFVPIRVLKCFTKMALAVMPDDEMPHFTRTMKWILESDDEKDLFRFRGDGCIVYFYPGVSLKKGVVLLRRKTTDTPLPYMLLILHMGPVAIQTHVSFTPCNDMFAGVTVPLPYVGTFVIPERGESERYFVRLDSAERKKDNVMSFQYSYQHREVRDKDGNLISE